MTVQEFQADKIEGTAKLLAFWLGAMPEDKQSWVPVVEGAAGLRTAREQVAECAAANRFFAVLLKGEKPTPFSPFDVKSEYASLEEAQQDLITSATECAAVVRGLSDADLAKEFVLRRGAMPGYQIIDFPYRNMAYHAGQINQLQLLYGDTEFHIPKG
ncbi:DinB family protein [Armatimonas sp.]|uniref:DinB family protein n=1 Tax=Armatimonas sp. TaxID=1872638 RepID=UPI00374CBCF1